MRTLDLLTVNIIMLEVGEGTNSFTTNIVKNTPFTKFQVGMIHPKSEGPQHALSATS